MAKEALPMNRASSLGSLHNNDAVAIVGGGPAGSFFAIHLLREARHLNRRIDVVIVEKRGPMELGTGGFQYRGCAFCAGGISPRLHEILGENDLVVPDEIVQGRFDHVWIQGQWKNFRLRVPKNKQMYAVFRGSLPGRRSSGLPVLPLEYHGTGTVSKNDAVAAVPVRDLGEGIGTDHQRTLVHTILDELSGDRNGVNRPGTHRCHIERGAAVANAHLVLRNACR